MRCDQCPVAAGRPCLGEAGGAFAYMCEFARDADPVKRRHVVDRSAIGVAPAAPAMPGLARQAANFLGSAAQHVAAGMPMASPEIKVARLAICEACERFTEDRRCAHMRCACFMDVKAGWADQSCPLDPPKWGPAEPT